jgi:2-C-methyl-D-erythritol 4-phosphate cytidylyltransferase
MGLRAVPPAATPAAASAALPKQYHLRGRAIPMVMHTLAAFAGVSALAAARWWRWRRAIIFWTPTPSAAFFTVECGGPTRADTVLGGLRALQERVERSPHDWVLVHDAARCLVTSAQIDALIDACASTMEWAVCWRTSWPTRSKHPLTDLAACAWRPPWTAAINGWPRPRRCSASVPAQSGHSSMWVQRCATDEASAMEAMGLHPRLVPGAVHKTSR